MTKPRILAPVPGMLGCFNCTAWSDHDEIDIAGERDGQLVLVGRKPTGLCRAAPPVRDPEAIGDTNAVWPVVTATDWCRSFKLDPFGGPGEPE